MKINKIKNTKPSPSINSGSPLKRATLNYKTDNSYTIKSGGQVVLMVLLVSALMMTIGLSVSKSTITETKVDTDEDLLKQAFNTAESGVEYYLSTGNKQYSETNSSATITTVNIGGNAEINSGGVVLSGEPFSFWLVNHNIDKTIGTDRFTGNINQICVDSSFTGGLKVDLFVYNSGSYAVNRFGYNMNNGNSVNGFSQINGNCTGSISVSEGMLLVVTPIGGNTKITVSGDTTFPSQGEEITSVGQMSSGVNTKIIVANRFNEIPPFMLETIVAGDSVLSQ